MRHVLIVTVLLAPVVCGCSSYKPLFNGKDLAGWVEVGSKGAWSVDGEVLKCDGRKDGYAWLSTEKKYSDFEISLEWRIEPEVNAGVFCRALDRKSRTSKMGFEVQIKDDRQDPDLTDVTGAVFSRIPAAGKFSKPIGEWNHYKITCVGRQLRIELNGKLIFEGDMDAVVPTEEGWEMKEVPNTGYIGLQNHGDPVEFRNIRIRELK